MFSTIEVNIGNVHVQSTNCIDVNVAGGLHNQCMNHTMATGNNTSERPHHTNYAIESIRIISFNNWPQFKHQTPQQLAEAGFFYAGYEDEVICFYCNGRLKNWKSNGVPWVQHARWFPYCPFVRIVKGNQFIRTIQDRFSQLDNKTGLEEENRQLKEQKTCKICLNAEVGVVFQPYGHLCCCVQCASALQKCPICRKRISGSVRTFIP